jgi:hypothetical protein
MQVVMTVFPDSFLILGTSLGPPAHLILQYQTTFCMAASKQSIQNVSFPN